MEVAIAGTLAGLGVRMRVARSREFTASALDIRCRAPETIAVIEAAATDRDRAGAADARHR
jgi:hypothetical protein